MGSRYGKEVRDHPGYDYSSLFPAPESEPPPDSSWGWIAGLVAAGALVIIVLLVVSS